MQTIEVSDVRVRFVENATDNLVAWASCVINESLYINSIAVRREEDGSLSISYPFRKTRTDYKRYYFRPLNIDADRIIKESILGRIGV